MAMRLVGTASRSASAAVAVRIVSMHTAGGSVRRLPAACPGNSTRSTATPASVTASSMATRPDCSRPALAPGVSTSPAILTAAIRPSWRVVPRPVRPGWKSERVRESEATAHVRRRGPPRSAGRRGWRGRRGRRGRAVESVRPVGGTVWMVEVAGHQLVAKVGPGVLDEAAGLRQLGAAAGAPPVPDVVFAEDDLLITTAVVQVPRTARHDDMLGRGLARLHQGSAAHWGGGSSWVGACPVDPVVTEDGASFYGSRLLDLASRCALEHPVRRVVARLGDLLPPGGPAWVHGDLWWGNVLFGANDRAWLIDPSVHGGHPEEDLAMLALFGTVPDPLLHAYDEVRPLQVGWQRVGLFQLAPLLVHAVLFGDGYRSQAEAVARRYA